MDHDEIRALVAALGDAIDVAPVGQLFDSRSISLEFLAEFGGELGSEEDNPEHLLIQREENARFKRIIEAFNHSITQ